MKPHKHAELIKAWADGAEIECRIGGEWNRINKPNWHEVMEYRIKPPEVPQWRKYMAQALKEGKVVEVELGLSNSWVTTVLTVKDFLDPNMIIEEELYRIKPEPKPDVVKYVSVKLHWHTKGIARWDNVEAKCANLKIVFNGETGELKESEVLR